MGANKKARIAEILALPKEPAWMYLYSRNRSHLNVSAFVENNFGNCCAKDLSTSRYNIKASKVSLAL